jgi:hypothetical protein
MSIQWADDFGSYGTGVGSGDRMLDGLYAHVKGDIVADPDPSGTGQPVWQRGQSDFQPLRRVCLTSSSSIGMAQRVYMSNLPNDDGDRWGLGLHQTNNHPIARIQCEPTGALTIVTYDNDQNPTERQTTPGPVLNAHSWEHVEWLCDTETHIAVRVNGIEVLHWPDTDDWGDGREIAQTVFQSYSGGSSYNFYLRDYIMWDKSGTYCNDFLGSVIVYGITTTPPDVALHWDLVGASSGAAALANVPPLDDTQYISADNTPPAASVFDMTNLPTDVTSVKAIVTQVRTRKTDGGDGNLQVGLKSNTDVGLGADRPVTVAYTYYTDVFHVDPHTDAPWSPGAVDAAQLQVNRTV